MDIHPTHPYPHGLNDGPFPSAGDRTVWRRFLRVLGRVFWAVLLLPAVVLLAWVLSNWNDAEPKPRPPELLLSASSLSPENNTAFAFIGLTAAADRHAAQVGRELWALDQRAADQQRALQQHPEADEKALKAAAEAHAAQRARLSGPPLPSAEGEPWVCHGVQAECWATYMAQADKLAQQRQLMAVQGARCDAVLDAPMNLKTAAPLTLVFEELLPAVLHPAAPLAAHASNSLICARWWQTGAVLAYRQGRKDETLRLLRRSQQLHLALQNGSHTLLAQMLATGMARRHFSFVSGLAALAPDWAGDLLPLVASAGPAEEQIRRWVRAESAFGHAVWKEVGAAAGPPEPVAGAGAGDGAGAGAGAPWADRVLNRFSRAVAGHRLWWHRLGFHPQRTLQQHDGQWLQLLRQVEAGLPAALKLQPGPDDKQGRPMSLAWRNTFGHAVAELSNGAYSHYLRRHLDLELHREAAALALHAQRLKITPAARAAWAQQQPASPALRERSSWSADGRTLAVRSWAEDGQVAGRKWPPHELINITLDPAAMR